MTMRVGYARVATQEQDLALQLDALQAVGCERIFTEKASGAPRDRPQRHAALDSMRSGDTLVLWKLDRFARSLRQLLETVEALNGRQIGLRSRTEAIDTGPPGGTLVFHLFGALAAFERSIMRERTRAGLAAARARGRTGGRPPALSAVDKTAARALLPDPAITVEAVAQRLQVSPATLYRHFPGGRRGLEEAMGSGDCLRRLRGRRGAAAYAAAHCWRVRGRPMPYRLVLAAHGACDGLGCEGRKWHEGSEQPARAERAGPG